MMSHARTLAAAALAMSASVAVADGKSTADVEAGKALALDRAKGNCIACHQIEGGEGPGNIGPPLVAMKARYPDVDRLRAQIWNSTDANPVSIMPPFGKNEILTDAEIDNVVAFVMTL